MAEATSFEDCVARHQEYHIDIDPRLNGIQTVRMKRMLLPVLPGEVVLDVGCNSGYIGRFLPRGCGAHGVDVAPELVKAAKRRLESAQVAPAEELPFADRSMDVVVLGEIIEHVYDPLAVLREAARVARRMVVGSTPHVDGKWGPDGPRAPAGHRYHVRCFTEAEITDLLGSVLDGVEVEAIRDGAGVAQFMAFRGHVRR